MKLSVIVPTYDEAENIPSLLYTLKNILHDIDYEIVISDDDSPDCTWALAEQMAKGDPRIRVLRRIKSRGLGASVIDGFGCASGESIACIDADLQHDPAILPQMFVALERGADLVIGSRYVSSGSTEAWKWTRHLESRIATRMAQYLLGIRLSDPMSGYFMLRKEDFLRVGNRLNGDGFKILLEIVAHLKPQRITEIPYIFRGRTAGRSKLSRRIVASYVQQLWRLSGENRSTSASGEEGRFAA